MAERRMFAKSVVETDSFLDMPLSSQCLYFHLSMNADDDGFVSNPKTIKRSIGAADDDVKILASKGYIIPFESGIVVITHWKKSNQIQKDRYKPTDYSYEISLLKISKNKIYEIVGIQPVSKLDTTCIQPVSGSDTQYSIGKLSTDKLSIEGEGTKRKRFIPPSLEEVTAYCKERNNSVNPNSFVDFYEAKGWCIGKNKMKDWKAAIRTWENKSRQENKQQEPESDADLDKYRMLVNQF